LSENVSSQVLHIVDVSNFTFTPSQLTIGVGDIVRWRNITGIHNVVADDNSFTSGAPSSSNWEYEFVFNNTGINPYYCSLHGGPGGVGMSGVITVEATTNITNEAISSYKYDLEQNYPNPFNPSTTIKYQIEFSEPVSLKIYNILGNEVAELVNEVKQAGNYSVSFDARNITSGVYFYKLQAGSFVQARKMIILK
jgi:plastocyanin